MLHFKLDVRLSLKGTSRITLPAFKETAQPVSLTFSAAQVLEERGALQQQSGDEVAKNCSGEESDVCLALSFSEAA